MASIHCNKRTVELYVTEDQLAYLRELVQLDEGIHADMYVSYDNLNDYLEEVYRGIHGPDPRQDPSPGYREE